jgi:hypothetical protein
MQLIRITILAINLDRYLEHSCIGGPRKADIASGGRISICQSYRSIRMGRRIHAKGLRHALRLMTRVWADGSVCYRPRCLV